MAGTFHGTPQFAPPEQLRGEPLDVRADIYAVGATLYYLLTGRPPFDDHDLMALVTRIATEAASIAARARAERAAGSRRDRAALPGEGPIGSTGDLRGTDRRPATVQLHRADTGEPGTPRARGNHRRCHPDRAIRHP